MRFIVVLLLLAVFFLSGIVYGMNQEESQTIEEPTVVEVEEEPAEIEEIESTVETVNIPVSQPMADADASAQYTQKTASILGAGVKGFFELLMQVLYQTAQLFF